MIRSHLSRLLVALLPEALRDAGVNLLIEEVKAGRAREDALETALERALADVKTAAKREAQRLELIDLLADREATLEWTRGRIAELEEALATPSRLQPLSHTVRPEVEIVDDDPPHCPPVVSAESAAAIEDIQSAALAMLRGEGCDETIELALPQPAPIQPPAPRFPKRRHYKPSP